jgi:hypothetical protein
MMRPARGLARAVGAKLSEQGRPTQIIGRLEQPRYRVFRARRSLILHAHHGRTRDRTLLYCRFNVFDPEKVRCAHQHESSLVALEPASARPSHLEWPIRVFPLIPRGYRRQDIPMLDYLSVLDPKQIVERSWPGREISLRQDKYKVAFSHETAGAEI